MPDFTLDFNKHKTRCVIVYEERLKTDTKALHQDHATCLLFAPCADGPLHLKHVAVKPP